MPDQPAGSATCMQRLVNAISLMYLLSMALYLLLRFTIQDRIWIISQLNSFALLLFIPLPIVLLMALLARSRRAVAYALPVLIIALLWFGPRFLPKNLPIPSANTPKLRVISSNISHFNIAPERVPALAASQNPDVIFLQEVQPDTQNDVLSALDEAYPYRTVQDDAMRLSLYTAVNITYSRLHFITSEQVNPQIPDMPLIYRNVIELDGQPIVLYNIHLLSPGGGGRFQRLTRFATNYFVRYALNFDDTARNRQIDALLIFLAAEPYLYIVAGDFNTSDFSMTYIQLAAHMHDSFADAAVGLGGSWPAARALGLPSFLPPLIRIDYIWHSDGLQPTSAWEGDFVGSDHLPMFADFVTSK